MRIVCKEQRTHEWHQARMGKITATGVAKAMHFVAKGSVKRGDKRIESAADRNKYIKELAWELITRVPTHHYVSKPMEIGAQYEGEARTEYWMQTGNEVDQTGFVLHPTLDYLGCSPDGLGKRKGVEIKVPLLETHEDYLTDGVVPEDCVPQLQCNMLCCEMPEWDFVSYAPSEIYPDFPDDLRLLVIPLKADPAMHAEMEQAATTTMEEVVSLVASIVKRYPRLGKPAPRNYAPEPPIEAYDPSKSFSDNCEFLDQYEVTP